MRSLRLVVVAAAEEDGSNTEGVERIGERGRKGRERGGEKRERAVGS